MYHQTLVPPDHASGAAGLSQTFQSPTYSDHVEPHPGNLGNNGLLPGNNGLISGGNPGGNIVVPSMPSGNFIVSCGAGATGTLHRNSLSRGVGLLSSGSNNNNSNGSNNNNLAYGIPSRALSSSSSSANERNSPTTIVGVASSSPNNVEIDAISRQQQQQSLPHHRSHLQQQQPITSLHQQMLLTGNRSGDEDSPSIPTPPSTHNGGVVGVLPNPGGAPSGLSGLPASSDLRFMGVSPLSPGRSPLSSYRLVGVGIFV